MNAGEWKRRIGAGEFKRTFTELYGRRAPEAPARYTELVDKYSRAFGDARELSIFSAPGRTEIGGNHTDHQHGMVMAASVDLDAIAAAAPNGSGRVCVISDGYGVCEADLRELSASPARRGTMEALVQGVLAGFERMGCPLSGFNAYVMSDVLPGSGLSSSAAFEVLIGCAANHLLFDGRASAVDIAKAGQYAENVYFGKPCGLMDQTASAVGGAVAIDFNDPERPVVSEVDFDFIKSGHVLCVIDTGADHAGLTDEYAAITEEMDSAAAFFGRSVLRDVPEDEFMKNIVKLREVCGDRAVLRAMHFYDDSGRVPQLSAALSAGDFDSFLQIIDQSGRSSWEYLQNIYPSGEARRQPMALALAMCRRLLKGRGACRVHGGGFAGTVQAFVPEDIFDEFSRGIEEVFGPGSCRRLMIRPAGGIKL